MKQKIGYWANCLKKTLFKKGMSCPSCGYSYSKVIDRKYLVTTLCRCEKCQLLYRAPTTTAEENKSFYQEEYRQGFTTNIPSREQLRIYLHKNFFGSEKDYSTYINILKAAGVTKGSKIFDFGCSWGYGCWQFKRHGFDVEAFEISAPRVAIAKNELGIKVHSDLSDISGPFDVFFSAHVLEHVPSVKEVIDFGLSVLKPGGLFVAFAPNGSADYFKKNFSAWHKLWGLVHPNFLDDVYYKSVFFDKHLLLSSAPYNLKGINKWKSSQEGQTILDLSGEELLVMVRNSVMQ